ncbi:MAG: ASCH domain-containing protein [Betaproteobacteria bacterium]
MKAITLIQPWASLVAIGAKRIETRSWATDYRGPLAIHAAKGFPKWAQELCYKEPFATLLFNVKTGYYHPWKLPRGVVIAVCALVGCRRIKPQDVMTWRRSPSVRSATSRPVGLRGSCGTLSP